MNQDPQNKFTEPKFIAGAVVGLFVITLVLWAMDIGSNHLSFIFAKYDTYIGPMWLKTKKGKLALADAGDKELKEDSTKEEEKETATNGDVGVDRYGRCNDGSIPIYGKCKKNRKSGWTSRPFWSRNIRKYKEYRKNPW